MTQEYRTSWLTPMRALAALLTGLAVWALPNMEAYFTTVTTIGMGHYFVSLVYSRRNLKVVTSRPNGVSALIGLLAAGAGIFLLGTDWTDDHQRKLCVFFGIHHVFNEVYLARQFIKVPENARTRGLRVASNVLHGFLYVAILANSEELFYLHRPLVIAGLATSACVYLGMLVHLRRDLTVGQVIDLTVFEALGGMIAILVLMGGLHVHFLDLVLYHFVFWLFVPLEKLGGLGRKAIRQYLTLNIGFTTAFVAISPLGLVPYAFASEWGRYYASMFFVWSYIHITLSFAVSRAQPDWIVRYFLGPLELPTGTGQRAHA